MATLAGKKLLASHLGLNFQWTDDGQLAGAGGAFENILVVPELRALHLPDPQAPATTLSLTECPEELRAQFHAAVVALHNWSISQIAGASVEA